VEAGDFRVGYVVGCKMENTLINEDYEIKHTVCDSFIYVYVISMTVYVDLEIRNVHAMSGWNLSWYHMSGKKKTPPNA
jgi:hypothetical protein